MANPISELFDANIWQAVEGFENQTDITYHQHVELGVVRIAFNRPEICTGLHSNSNFDRMIA